MIKRICKTILCLLIAAVLAGIDQVIKKWAVITLKNSSAMPVIPKLVQFNYVENFGAAFNILNEKRWLLVIFSVAMSLLILVFLFITLKEKNTHRWVRNLEIVSGVMILAGAFGNLIDRLMIGHVVDYIQVLFIDFPVFNMADCLIVVGGILVVIAFLFDKEPKEKTKQESESAEEETEVQTEE